MDYIAIQATATKPMPSDDKLYNKIVVRDKPEFQGLKAHGCGSSNDRTQEGRY